MDGNIASNGQFVPNGAVGNFNAGGNPVISSGQGDIILTPSQSRSSRKKWPFVAVGVLFVIAIVTGIAAMVVGNNDNDNSAAAKEAFISYYNLMTDGQDEEYSADTSNEWYFYNLRNGWTAEANLSDYIDSLTTAYHLFYSSAIKISEYQQLLNVYNVRFDLWSKYVSLPVLRRNIMKLYIDQNESAAIDYVGKLTKYNSDDESVMIIYDFLENYLTSELKLIKLYNGRGCVVNYGLDMFCMVEYMDSDANYEKWALSQQTAEDALRTAMTELIWNDFMAETNKFEMIFGEQNE